MKSYDLRRDAIDPTDRIWFTLLIWFTLEGTFNPTTCRWEDIRCLWEEFVPKTLWVVLKVPVWCHKKYIFLTNPNQNGLWKKCIFHSIVSSISFCLWYWCGPNIGNSFAWENIEMIQYFPQPVDQVISPIQPVVMIYMHICERCSALSRWYAYRKSLCIRSVWYIRTLVHNVVIRL